MSYPALLLLISPLCLSGCTDRGQLHSKNEGGVTAPISTECGAGDVTVELGYGRPFEPLDDLRQMWVEYGLQGGYHVDVSLLLIGAIDPDRVTIEIDLELNPVDPLPSQDTLNAVYGRHQTIDWYLLFPNDDEPRGCYFYKARVFLFDPSGEVPTLSMVEHLDQRTATILVTMTDQYAVSTLSAPVVLRWRSPDPETPDDDP